MKNNKDKKNLPSFTVDEKGYMTATMKKKYKEIMARKKGK